MKAPISLTAEELLAVLGKARERRLRDWVMLLFLYWHGFRVSEIAASSTRQLGLFFTLEKAEQRCTEVSAGAAIEEVRRRVKGKMRTCYLVRSDHLVARPGLTFDAIEGSQITVQRLKRSEQTTQLLQEHENPLLNEKLAWEEWMAERPRLGKKGGAKMAQKDVLMQNGPDTRVFEISRSQLFRIYRRCATEAGLPRRKRHPHCLRHTIATDLVEAGVKLPHVQAHLGHKSLASTGIYTLPREDAVSKAVGKAIRGKHEFRRAQQGILFPEEN
jgi:site-specific recombinase XerD